MTVQAINDGYEIKNEAGVNEDLIDGLEELLKQAKDGEIVGLCGAIQYGDDAVSSFAYGYRRHYPMMGALTGAIHRMLKDND